MTQIQIQLKRDLHRLFRSMTFISKHPALKRGGKDARQMAEVYQQLGLAWEFLALQCRHTEGWRKTADGNLACKICGTHRGVTECWRLLSDEGRKVIGRKTVPVSKETFANKKAASLVNDTIEFHGAKLNVDVHHRYRSKLFHKMKSAICVSDERTVRLIEDGVEYHISGNMIEVELIRHKLGQKPPYSSFLSELPRQALQKFPVMLRHDDRGRFTGLLIFRPIAKEARAAKSKK